MSLITGWDARGYYLNVPYKRFNYSSDCLEACLRFCHNEYYRSIHYTRIRTYFISSENVAAAVLRARMCNNQIMHHTVHPMGVVCDLTTTTSLAGERERETNPIITRQTNSFLTRGLCPVDYQLQYYNTKNELILLRRKIIREQQSRNLSSIS